MKPSPIRYARAAGDVHIAYRTLGEGPSDLVFASGAVSNVELDWDEPLYADLRLDRRRKGRLVALADRAAEEQALGVDRVERLSPAPTWPPLRLRRPPRLQVAKGS